MVRTRVTVLIFPHSEASTKYTWGHAEGSDFFGVSWKIPYILVIMQGQIANRVIDFGRGMDGLVGGRRKGIHGAKTERTKSPSNTYEPTT